MSNHSQAPWRYHCNPYPVVLDAGGRIICELTYDGTPHGANGLLIESAPDLLAERNELRKQRDRLLRMAKDLLQQI